MLLELINEFGKAAGYKLDKKIPLSFLYTNKETILFTVISKRINYQGINLPKEMATHSSILAWRIPWTKEPGGLQSMGSQRVGHDWAKHTQGGKRPVL